MRLLAFALVLSSLAAFAEDAVPDAGVSSPAPEVVIPPPAPPAPPAPSVLDQVFAWVRPYVVFKPTVIVSSGAVESYSQPNATAITAASNPVLAMLPDQPRLSFQIGQSRTGLWFNEKGALRGQLELDFVDFTKASPTVASNPRLRIAKLEWSPTDWLQLQAGQDWDLHAPVNPHGQNLVGARFLSGNSGFMRQQVKLIGKAGVFELAAAAGMEGVNTSNKDNAFELSVVPTGAVRFAWLWARAASASRVSAPRFVSASVRRRSAAPSRARSRASWTSASAAPRSRPSSTWGRTSRTWACSRSASAAPPLTCRTGAASSRCATASPTCTSSTRTRACSAC